MMALIIVPCSGVLVIFFIFVGFFVSQEGVCKPLHHRNWPLHPQCQAKCPPANMPTTSRMNCLAMIHSEEHSIFQKHTGQRPPQYLVQEDHLSDFPHLSLKSQTRPGAVSRVCPPPFLPCPFPPFPRPGPPEYRQLSGGGNYCE